MSELAELIVDGTCSRFVDGSMLVKEREEEGLGGGIHCTAGSSGGLSDAG